MQEQLEKINTFYRAKELQLEVTTMLTFWVACLIVPVIYYSNIDCAPVKDMLRNQGKPGARALAAFRSDCADLRKYAVVR